MSKKKSKKSSKKPVVRADQATQNEAVDSTIERESVVAEAQIDDSTVSTETTVDATTETKAKGKRSKSKVVEVKAKDVAKKKKDKVKKPNKVAQSLKNTGNELKKVTWPTFKQVVKQTSVVLVFVVVFALVLLGFDQLCIWLTSFLY